jgi:hypothetical protein
MAGFTLSGGFHFDPSGEGAVAPAGITARGFGGMTFAPPPPPPPSFEAYTYQAIERVQYFKDYVRGGGFTKTVTTASYGGQSPLQENDVMIVAVQAQNSEYSEPPTGWTQIEGVKRNGNAIPGYGISFNAYYKICDDSGSHTYEASSLSNNEHAEVHMVAYRNLRTTGGPETSPFGAVNTRLVAGSEAYPEMDLHEYNNTATSDDDTSWVLFFGQHEFGHRTLYGPNASGGTTNVIQGYNVTKRYTFHEARNQTEDVAAYSRYIASNTVWYGGQPKNPVFIGIGIELMARPGHSGGAWNTGLDQPE